MKTRIFIAALCICLATGNAQTQEGLAKLELRLEKAMDSLNEKPSIAILGNMVSLDKVDNPEVDNEKESSDPLVAKIERFFRNRKLWINFPSDGSTADYFGRALGQRKLGIELKGLTHGASEARMKLKKVILPVLLALKLKALIVLPIVLTVIGLIGIKGLGAGLMALMLSSAVALKALLTPPPPYPARVTYGVVKPYDIHHEHWHRSQEEANQPYKGWAPEYNEQYPYQEGPAFVP